MQRKTLTQYCVTHNPTVQILLAETVFTQKIHAKLSSKTVQNTKILIRQLVNPMGV